MAIVLNKENFESTIKSSLPVIIKVSATWCGPCQQMIPVFELIEREFADRVTFAHLDVDEARELAIQFGITSVPTILFLKNGDVIAKEVGYVGKDALKMKIEKFLS
jgi:thioredoxin 1